MYLNESSKFTSSLPPTINLVFSGRVLSDELTVSILTHSEDKFIVLKAEYPHEARTVGTQIMPPAVLAQQTMENHGSNMVRQRSNTNFPAAGPVDVPSRSATLQRPILNSFAQTLFNPGSSQSNKSAVQEPARQSEGAVASKTLFDSVSHVPGSLTVPLRHSVEPKQEPLIDMSIPRVDEHNAVPDVHSRRLDNNTFIYSDEEFDNDGEGMLLDESGSEAGDLNPTDEQDLPVESGEETLHFDGSYMREFYKVTDVKRLEATTKRGLALLSTLESLVHTQESDGETNDWLKQIALVKKLAVRTRTVVGVVGNTGVGKSSVLNALLDEERLIPTNCMRACTAVPTEIAWNDSNDPEKIYRAEIEFISESDWKKELDILFSEMFTNKNEVSREIYNTSSEAGVAYEKVKAVYPELGREELLRTSVNDLLHTQSISMHLGCTKHITGDDPRNFYLALHRYIDSKERDGEKKSTYRAKKSEPNKIQWWPLIKCVKIYLKARALSTGAVLVDLPGVQDSNAARVAVAQNYMKQCSGLWIVAPITRAVDDKVARDLLGGHFKRQMKFDGMISNVTFICSKTDDISVTEAIESLGLEEKVAAIDEQFLQFENEEILTKAEIEAIDNKIAESMKAFEQASREFDKWDELYDAHKEDETIYVPIAKLPENRKRHRLLRQTANKNPRYTIDDLEDYEMGDPVGGTDADFEASDASEDGGDEVNVRTPMSPAEVKAKREELKTAKDQARQCKKECHTKHAQLLRKTKDCRASKKELADRKRALCVAARNDWSRGHIQHDYAMGIKELDQECGQREDEDNFDPDIDIRNYDQVGRSLPVFCVSSRAYQTLSGRFPHDGATRGFHLPAQTEIPQLQDHCIKVTEKNRKAANQVFLKDLTKMLVSMSLWASGDSPGIKLTEEEREFERSLLEKRLKELEDRFNTITDDIAKGIKAAQKKYIQKRCTKAISSAVEAASTTSTQWGESQGDAGFRFNTYRALMRRSGGPFTNAKGCHDLNKQLSYPFERDILSGWEKCFQRVIPKVMKSFGESMNGVLLRFHNKVLKRARASGVGIAGIGLVAQKISLWEESFNQIAADLEQSLGESQKTTNREIAPSITFAMQEVYEACSQEAGECYRPSDERD